MTLFYRNVIIILLLVIFSSGWRAAHAVSVDAYEPDNTLGVAKPIALGETQFRSMSPKNDDDWLTFSASGTENIEVYINTTATNPPTVHLYNSTLQRLTSSGISRKLEYAELSPGVYYLWVEHSSVQRLLEYTIQLKATSSNGDQFELDNIASDAKYISSNQVQERSISPTNDIDWLTFTTTATGDIAFNLSTTASNYPSMNLYDEYFNRLAGSGFGKILRYNNLPAGNYYLKVKHSSVRSVLTYYLALSGDHVLIKTNHSGKILPVINDLLLSE